MSERVCDTCGFTIGHAEPPQTCQRCGAIQPWTASDDEERPTLTDGGTPGTAAHGPNEADRYHTDSAGLRAGEAPDQTSHAARALAQADARIEATEHADLPDKEVVLLTAIAGHDDGATIADIIDEWTAATDLSRSTANRTAGDLTDKGLLQARPDPTLPRRDLWSLTDVGRAWVRDYGNGGEA